MSDLNGARHVPTIEELRRAYEEGIPQTLLSGIQVKMRPVQPDKLLAAGTVPDILTPLVMRMIFPPPEAEVHFPDEVNTFLSQERKKAADTVEFVRAVDVVCAASLVDPSVVPYLPLSDRMWIFKLAFLPVEVLSRFRLKSTRDVGAVPDEQGDEQPTEPGAAVDRVTEPAESVHGVSVR